MFESDEQNYEKYLSMIEMNFWEWVKIEYSKTTRNKLSFELFYHVRGGKPWRRELICKVGEYFESSSMMNKITKNIADDENELVSLIKFCGNIFTQLCRMDKLIEFNRNNIPQYKISKAASFGEYYMK